MSTETPGSPEMPEAQGGGGYTKDERMWGMISHLTALAGFIIPFGNILGPLIVWLLKKDEFPFVNDQAKESLNFQISILIYMAIASVLLLVAIGAILMVVVAIFALIEVIMASIKANDGIPYRYPLTIRFIK